MKYLYLIVFLAVVSARTVEEIDDITDFTKDPSYHLLPPQDECGYIYRNDKVVGGTEAEFGELTYMAQLFLRREDKYREKNIDSKSHCGGSIISKRYVLTAGHCIPKDLIQSHQDSRYRYLMVRIGEYQISKNPDCSLGVCSPPVQDIVVEEIILHENYKEYENNWIVNDISLLRLEEDIVFNRYVSPVCLPFDPEIRKQDLVGDFVLVSGWGLISKASTPDILQKLWLSITSHEVCEEDWAKYEVLESHLCARKLKASTRNQDAARGDSGGPLVYPAQLDNHRSRYVQLGVVSLGDDATTTYPWNRTLRAGVYARVTYYLPWILKKIR